jgi:hypothetical protein
METNIAPQPPTVVGKHSIPYDGPPTKYARRLGVEIVIRLLHWGWIIVDYVWRICGHAFLDRSRYWVMLDLDELEQSVGAGDVPDLPWA